MTQMLPTDIGAAAAYEAWRSWTCYSGMYNQTSGGNPALQREALVGLAVGEGKRRSVQVYL